MLDDTDKYAVKVNKISSISSNHHVSPFCQFADLIMNLNPAQITILKHPVTCNIAKSLQMHDDIFWKPYAKGIVVIIRVE